MPSRVSSSLAAVLLLALACTPILAATPAPPPEHVQLSPDELAFLTAAEAGNLDVVKTLITKLGAKHKAIVNDVGDNALFAAASNGSLPVVQYLVEQQNYSLTEKDGDGATPLHVSAWHGHLPVVQYILEKGVSIDSPCDNGWTPLLGAARWGELEVVKYLHKRGARLNLFTGDGAYNTLMIAAMHGHTDVVQYLLSNKADPNARDPHGRTALQLARENAHPGTVELLEKLQDKDL